MFEQAYECKVTALCKSWPLRGTAWRLLGTSASLTSRLVRLHLLDLLVLLVIGQCESPRSSQLPKVLCLMGML